MGATDNQQQYSPTELSAELEELAVRKVAAQFPGAIQEVIHFRGETTIRIPRERVTEVLTFLRDDPDLRYNMLTDLTATDWPEREQRFDVVYELNSLVYNQHLRVKAAVGEEEKIASAVGIWAAANWEERECYDMFGIIFDGHPELKRILLPQDWEGFPLRKDYPLEGYHG